MESCVSLGINYNKSSKKHTQKKNRGENEGKKLKIQWKCENKQRINREKIEGT